MVIEISAHGVQGARGISNARLSRKAVCFCAFCFCHLNDSFTIHRVERAVAIQVGRCKGIESNPSVNIQSLCLED